MPKAVTIILSALLILLTSCGSDPLDVDVSGHKANIRFDRMDNRLFGKGQDELVAEHSQLLEEQGVAYEVYFSQMLGLGSPHDPNASFNLFRFTTDAAMTEVQEAIKAKYADLSTVQGDLEKAFSHVKYHFPSYKLPRIVTCQTGFYVGVFDMDSIISISLEMYLGPENEIVQRLSPQDYPLYLKDLMQEQYIVVDVMTNWLTNRFQTPEAVGPNFASNIIFHGKIMHLLDATLREYSDHRKLKYEEEQLQWCEENELNIWSTIIRDDRLRTLDEKVIHQWLTEGPFTGDLPQESPPKVGIWLGWQMVQSYLADHPETTPEQLMTIDHETILLSYKPGK